MKTLLLPPHDWPRLNGTELETVWPHLRHDAQVLIVEDDGEIVACWALMPVYHLEGMWIAPAHRKRGGVGRRLWVGMQRLIRAYGLPSVATSACSDEIRALLARVGATKLQGDHYVLSIGGR